MTPGDLGLVDLWLVDTCPAAPSLAHTLDADERRRAAALDPARRAGFVAAHGVARAVAARALGIEPAEVRWRVGRHGKPEVGRVRVSLSRSAGRALVACTADRAVGVDLQEVGVADPARVARRFFPAVEARHVGDDRERYTRLFARKEACVKAAGGRLFPGLAVPVLDPVAHRPEGPYRVRDVPAPPGCAAAVALAGAEDFHVREHRWPEEMP